MFQRLFIFICLLVLLLVSGTSHAARCYVSADGQASANGLSWASSTTLHQALATPNCTVIWMKSGVYYPVVPADFADVKREERAKYFLVDRPLLLLGGFNGTETSVTQRDLDANAPTILSGDINQDDLNADGNHINESWDHIAELTSHPPQNSDVVLVVHQKPGSMVSFTHTNSILNGFTVTGARRLSGVLLVGQGAEGTQFAPRLSRLVIQGNIGMLDASGFDHLPFANDFRYYTGDIAGGLNLLFDRSSLMGAGAQLFRLHVEGNSLGGVLIGAASYDSLSSSKMLSLHSSSLIKNHDALGYIGAMTTRLPTLVSRSHFDGNAVGSRPYIANTWSAHPSTLAGYSKLVVTNSVFSNQKIIQVNTSGGSAEVKTLSAVKHFSYRPDEVLRIMDSEVKNNQATFAISSYNRSSARLSNINVHHNSGIGVASFGGEMQVQNSSIHNNQGSGLIVAGNAHFDKADVNIHASTVFNNNTYNTFDLVLKESRDFASGIDVGSHGRLTLTDSTVWMNDLHSNYGQPAEFRRSVLFDCQSNDVSILKDMGGNAYHYPGHCGKTSPSSIAIVNPLLTWDESVPSNPVLMPATNSPLIDATPCPTEATKDQRGVARPQGSQCDIGSVERRFGSKTLTVTIAPDSIGKGNVSAQPSAASGTGTIENCTNRCSAQYDDESIVSQITLVANPTPPNKAFWSGDCVSNGRGNQAVVSIDKPTLQCTVAFKTDPIDPTPVENQIFQNGFE